MYFRKMVKKAAKHIQCPTCTFLEQIRCRSNAHFSWEKIKEKNSWKTFSRKNDIENGVPIIIETVLTVECYKIINKIFFCFKKHKEKEKYDVYSNM